MLIAMRRAMVLSSVCCIRSVRFVLIEPILQSDLAKDGTQTCMASSSLKSQLGMKANGNIISFTALRKSAEA